MTQKLIPCPFCGGEAVLTAYFDNKNGMRIHIFCSNCDTHSGYFEDIETAFNSWNSRVNGSDIRPFLLDKEAK